MVNKRKLEHVDVRKAMTCLRGLGRAGAASRWVANLALRITGQQTHRYQTHQLNVCINTRAAG